MDGNSANGAASKPRRFFQFTLSMSLVLVTAICGYLAGYLRGSRQAAATTMNMFPMSTMTYQVDDLLFDPALKDPREVDWKGLTTKIQQDCSPDFWDESGGRGSIYTDIHRYALTINGNHVVHEQVADLLIRLRVEKFGPLYKFEPGQVVENASWPFVSRKTYYVDDLVLAIDPETPAYTDYGDLIAMIQQKCSPDSWAIPGHPDSIPRCSYDQECPARAGYISPNPLNVSVVVDANQFVHKEIEALLKQIRVERFGPEYKKSGWEVARHR